MADDRDRAAHADDVEQTPLEHLLTVSSGKPFENLSWRLLQLLIDGVRVERRQLGEGDTLKISEHMDAVYVDTGSLTLREKIPSKAASSPTRGKTKKATGGQNGADDAALPKAPGMNMSTPASSLRANDAGIPMSVEAQSRYRNTSPLKIGGVYEAARNTAVRIFFKVDKTRRSPGSRRGAGEGSQEPSRWDWLCKRSLVARRALLTKEALSEPHSMRYGEIVLLSSKDLVEYLPALTDLLAQAMALGTDSEEPALSVCVVRFDPAARKIDDDDPHWEPCQITSQRRIDICTERLPNRLSETMRAAAADHDYVFVDPYDRASDLAALQVKTLTTRGRVASPLGGAALEVPGSTLTKQQFDSAFIGDHDLDGVDSIVHVARNFRLTPPCEGKLNFHAVVLDSRTARFEAGGTQDRRQRRSADDPVPSKVDPPDGSDDYAPTTRLHLNVLRLKKAWEQSPNLLDVCDALDEPNAPSTGDRRGYWKTAGFFERWVRDLRFRRVGVALGGGGATGFSHLAVVQALRSENIPIDLVAGTSFGALVGAYYCSHGLDGLEMLGEQALLLTGVASLTMFTSAFFEHLVNISIDYRPMWELPIPFYAVATDIETGKPAIFPGPAAANPTVGFAVRASGSLPGFFAPAVAGDARYVDGGAVSNVPVLPLIRRGADIVIGSNAFPFRKTRNTYTKTALRALLPPPFGRLAERLIAELNPGNRMTDAARSLSLSLADGIEKEGMLASALYEHKQTDVKYWEFHRASRVLAAATKDLKTGDALPAALNAYRLLNSIF